MKAHLYRFFKHYATLLVFTLLVTNCERDILPKTSHQEDNNLKVRIVNSDEVPDLFSKIEKDAKFYAAKGSSQNLDLDFDKIVEVTDSTNQKKYSLNFKSVSTGKYFTNVVIPKDSIGNFGTPLVYKYIPDDAFVESYRDGELTLKDFYGTIEVYDFYEYVNAQEQDNASYGGAPPGIAPCNSLQINTPGLNEGSNSGTGGVSCTLTTYVTTCWCNGELVGVHDHQPTVITYVINCSGESDVDDIYQKSSYMPLGCGNTNNNDNTPVGVNEPEIVPCLDDSNCYVDYINNVLSKLPNLTQQQADWIADFDNIQKVVQLSDFLDENDSQQAINFAKEAVIFLISNIQYNFSQYENWFGYEYPDLVPNSPIVNPENITYGTPITQQTLPSFDNFLNSFPKKGTSGNYTEMPTSEVYYLVGGSLLTSHLNNPEGYSNACSIRGSRGLLYSGIQIPILHYDTQRTQKGGDNKNYILDAVSFNKYMIDKFGDTPHKLEGTDANNPTKIAQFLNGKNGIYVIINNSAGQAGYSGHVDAIINGICIGGAYTGVTGGVKSIRIWELD